MFALYCEAAIAPGKLDPEVAAAIRRRRSSSDILGLPRTVARKQAQEAEEMAAAKTVRVQDLLGKPLVNTKVIYCIILKSSNDDPQNDPHLSSRMKEIQR